MKIKSTSAARRSSASMKIKTRKPKALMARSRVDWANKKARRGVKMQEKLPVPEELGRVVETQVQTSTKDGPHFRFESLPPEVRNEVYKLLLSYERGIVYKAPSGGRHTEILRVSSRIHIEAAAIPYGYNRFVFFPYYKPYSTYGTIPQLPRQYCNLITKVTLKVWDVEIGSKWRGAFTPCSPLVLTDNSWADGDFKPAASFRTDHLFRCNNLKSLTIEVISDFYRLAWGGGGRAHRMEDVPGIKELLQIRGLETLQIVDLSNVCRQNPELVKAKEKLDNLLRTELMKPRRR